ncbi:hypothetical protein BDV29DRAFT_4195 [Aspergillus leporis]|uniref:Uncharacterized protein n=1 Tax=Aspergillus leporis TaxID=41062 RepID=A0A5N5WZ71_9EURO|nr:hypothetical protein BDV29DRAFT_4195 [Aspergillus leporis]
MRTLQIRASIIKNSSIAPLFPLILKHLTRLQHLVVERPKHALLYQRVLIICRIVCINMQERAT